MAFNNSHTLSFLAASTSGIGVSLRVKLDASCNLVLAGAEDAEIGYTTNNASTNRQPVAVRMANSPGSVEVAAAGVITKGVPVFRAAGGKVAASGAAGQPAIGIALTPAGGDGHIIEMLLTNQVLVVEVEV